MEKQDIVDFITSKYFDQYAKENEGMLADIDELIRKVMLFELMWGIPVRLVVEKPPVDVAETYMARDAAMKAKGL